MFAGGDGGTSILVTQKQKVAFKMLVQEKHRTKRHLSVKMKESLFLPSTMMKLFTNSSYFSVSDTHRTHSSCSLKILLGSVKCSVIIHTAIKLVHVNWEKKNSFDPRISMIALPCSLGQTTQPLPFSSHCSSLSLSASLSFTQTSLQSPFGLGSPLTGAG